MSLNEATLSRQLGRAKEDLTAWNKALETNGVASPHAARTRSGAHLNAAYNTIRNRLKAAEAIRTRDEECRKHKAEKLAAAAAEKSEPKKAGQAAEGGEGRRQEREIRRAQREKEEGRKGKRPIRRHLLPDMCRAARGPRQSSRDTDRPTPER